MMAAAEVVCWNFNQACMMTDEGRSRHHAWHEHFKTAVKRSVAHTNACESHCINERLQHGGRDTLHDNDSFKWRSFAWQIRTVQSEARLPKNPPLFTDFASINRDGPHRERELEEEHGYADEEEHECCTPLTLTAAGPVR